ncbi:MAG: TonB-dependent receptor [Bacteroidota bacterium]
MFPPIKYGSSSVRKYLLLLFLSLSCPWLQAQLSPDTLATNQLETIQVKAQKIQKPWLKSAISSYTLSTELKEQLPQNSLQELLVNVPSIFSMNANNRAQDLRISVRGFGSRAAFGVRGVKFIVDGIPETTTDGQGQLDNLNLGIIQSIEVMNNGSSAFYGNASGGVINISTTDESAFQNQQHFTELGLGFQSFEGQLYQLTTGQKLGKTSLILHASHQQSEGYREQSDFQSTNVNIRLIHQLSDHSKIEGIFNYMDSPTADDPGGVNLMAFDSIPRSARDRNVQFEAGEAISQLKTSLRYTSRFFDKLDFQTYGFYSRRDFFGKLPFSNSGIIDLRRDFAGHGSSLSGQLKRRSLQWKWYAGYEWSLQNDERQRFVNMDGAQGAATLDQTEKFGNIGLFLLNDFTIGQWIVNAALRYDNNQIEAVDAFLSDGDNSGEIDLDDVNYSVGVAYQINQRQSIFASVSTSFETPTLNELSNNPTGGGLNPALAPQQATHFELGFKGFLPTQGRFQLTAFFIRSKDELLPFEIEQFPGRTFFRNIGRSDRLGAELFYQQNFHPLISLQTNWAVHQFTFEEYILDGEDFNGNRLPGTPNFQGNINLLLTPLARLHINLQNQSIGKIYTNDGNSEAQDSRSITSISIKYILEKDQFRFMPYIGINNLFKTKYADNIRINAFGQRYYEAAPDLFVYGGIRVRFAK